MKPLIVYFLDGRWFGSQVEWQRSGSGTYRHITGVDVPQSRPEIERFAQENDFAIQWRGPLPTEAPAQAG